MQNNELIKGIFKPSKQTETQKYRQPPNGTLTPYLRGLKKVLTCRAHGDYLVPSTTYLSGWLSKGSFSTSKDRDTGFLTLSPETPEPKLIVALMVRAIRETDLLLKERYIASVEPTMGFYQQYLGYARARKNREALAKLIVQDDQEFMLAFKGTYFAAKPLTERSASFNPISQKTSFLIALCTVLVGFFGAAPVVIKRHSKHDTPPSRSHFDAWHTLNTTSRLAIRRKIGVTPRQSLDCATAAK